jgi:predicted nuclease with TOPRIM domain
MSQEFSWESILRKVALIALVATLGILFASQNTKLQQKISVLEAKNQALEDSNKVLKSQREALLDSIHLVELQISSLEELEHDLSVKNDQLESKIKNLKSKYESANNHSVNYTTDSIKRYFSDFK